MGFAPMFFRLRPGYTEVNLNGKDYVLYCSSLVPRLLPRKMGRAVFLVRSMEMKLVWFVMIYYCNTLRLQLVVHCDWLYTDLAAPRTPFPSIELLVPSQQLVCVHFVCRFLGDVDIRLVWYVQERLEGVWWIQYQKIHGEVGRRGLGLGRQVSKHND